MSTPPQHTPPAQNQPNTPNKNRTDLVLVNDGPYPGYAYQGFEEVHGLARYDDGSLILATHRVDYSNDPFLPFSIPMAYRTFTPDPYEAWRVIDVIPEALRAFIASQPPGTNGRISNRNVQVANYTTMLTGRSITIERGPHLDHWVTY